MRKNEDVENSIGLAGHSYQAAETGVYDSYEFRKTQIPDLDGVVLQRRKQWMEERREYKKKKERYGTNKYWECKYMTECVFLVMVMSAKESLEF